MNPDWLLKHFDQISEAPDAVPRLRRFILDLAVRGKLVPQDPNDEPASQLLKRIQREKHELISQGKIKAHQNLPAISEKAIPFEIPRLWEWVGLAEILIKLTDGTHHSPPNFQDGDFKYITAKNIKPEGVTLDEITYVSKDVHTDIFSRCDPAKGDLLYVKDGATTGVVTVNDLDEPFSMLSSVALMKIGSGVFNRLLVYFLRSAFFYAQMRGFMKGAAITRVTLKRMAPALIPLPPFAEQHRIVEKVDELMALCDELEAMQSKRENRRDRLVAATLHSLENGRDGSPRWPRKQKDDFSETTPSACHDAACFFFNNLPRVTTRPEHIQQLRQTMLNLAVRGKLVPQDPNDEPVSDLLKEIQAEKRRLGKIKRDHVLPANGENCTSFEIPASWVWVNVSEVADQRLGKMLDKSKNKGTPRRYLRNVNVRWFHFDLSDILQMRFEDEELAEFSLRKGDVLICEGGEPGRSAVWDERETNIYFQKAIHRVRLFGSISPIFFVLNIRHDAVSGRLGQFFTGVGIKHFTGKGLARYTFPLPPIAEQQRIVKKVDELMALCDQLETQLASTTSTRSQLIISALNKALNGKSEFHRTIL